MTEIQIKMRLAFLIAACVISAYATGPTQKPHHHPHPHKSVPTKASPQHPPHKSVPTKAPPQHPKAKKAPLLDGGGKIIPDEYIVVFKEETSEETVQQHMNIFNTMLGLMNSTMNEHRLMYEYNLGTFRGYAAHMDQDTLERIRSLKEVSLVEKNQEVQAYGPRRIRSSCTTQASTPPWGLGRTTSRRPLPVDAYSYQYYGQGYGVNVYVIDTGIELRHKDFDNGYRAVWGFDAIDNPSPKTDLNGHGTHVAATAIGTNFGIAKWALAIAVRVLDANGRGSSAGVNAGVNWVAREHARRPGKKSVCNMSLGGGRSVSQNRIVDQAIRRGVHFSIAAGNSNRDACTFSPASTRRAVTVAASDIRDRFARFSNWGRCVDIIAPGVGVTSAWINNGMRTISGTSMAAPHVAGVMAKKLSMTNTPITPARMAQDLVMTATRGAITNIPNPRTPNRLVFYQCR